VRQRRLPTYPRRTVAERGTAAGVGSGTGSWIRGWFVSPSATTGMIDFHRGIADARVRTEWVWYHYGDGIISVR
jgi:hypothetical protein